MTAEGSSPKTTHAIANIAMPACMDRGTSCACSARAERGMARNVIPNALTKHAAARPLASASMATAIGMTTATSGCGIAEPPSKAWKTSHSEANPLSGGSAEIAQAPIKKNRAVRGIRLIRPPISSMLRVPRAWATEPAPRKSSPLKQAWLIV